ncbi:MAG: YidC/Oxa1 family membrane protein insertase [Candidatus Woykebacteria bacterium]
MIDLFVQVMLGLNKFLFNNLGLTIIVVGLLSRAVFYPFFANSIRYSKAMRDLKPRLDALRKKHKGDMQKLAAEQSRLFKEAGVNPAASVLGCFSMIIQIGIFFLLFQSINRVITSDINTNFLLWDLAKPDAYRVEGLPVAIPGVLVILTAVLTFFQSKMIAPPAETKKPQKRGQSGEKPDISDAISASTGQLAYIIPVVILVFGTTFAAGLALYWFVSTAFGIIQQYNITGLGGLEPWLKRLRPAK